MSKIIVIARPASDFHHQYLPDRLDLEDKFPLVWQTALP